MKRTEMSIVELLASSQGTRKNDANLALAESVAASGNSEAVSSLVELLEHRDRNIQSDAIKTLYEIGFRNPELIAPHWDVFIRLLSSRNNRLVWGAMAALTTVVPFRHRE
jgi:HEAT repeat protein